MIDNDTKNTYKDELEHNYYKTIQRIAVLRKIAIIIFACLIIAMTIITSSTLIEQQSQNSDTKVPPEPEYFIHLDGDGNITESDVHSYLWDEKNDIIYRYLFTNYEAKPIVMYNDNGEWMTREELINKNKKG